MPDIKGVDVASWQGEPAQWASDPGAQGIGWAGVKFTEVSPQFGVYENTDAKDDWDYLWERKLGRIAYLYAHPSVSIADTVAPFRSMTERLGLLPGDGVAVDLEVTDGLSPAQVASWARELFAELAGLYGRRIILYTFCNFVTDGNCEGLQNYLLWIASLTTPGLPQIPAPFKDWFAQQYGQNGQIDQDVAHFSDLAAMQAAMGAPQFETIVAVHVTTGEESLIALSHLVQCEIATMLRLTVDGAANREFSAGLADYINVGNLQAPMPKGIAVRFYERVRT